MSLPRPPSVLDAALAGATNPNLDISVAPTVAPTGAPKRTAEEMSSGDDDPMSARAEGCDITECSDADFDTWLEKQLPNLFAAEPAFEHKRFTNEMMQAWMTLTTAATKAQAACTKELFAKQKTARPAASDYGPRYRSLNYTDEDYIADNGMPEHMLQQMQADWDAEQARIEAMQQKPLTLATRAESVQAKISFV
jgi:hypothetical protein